MTKPQNSVRTDTIARVLRVLDEGGCWSATELSRHMGLSLYAVKLSLDHLVAAGKVECLPNAVGTRSWFRSIAYRKDFEAKVDKMYDFFMAIKAGVESGRIKEVSLDEE